jgi:hypothetical protein
MRVIQNARPRSNADPANSLSSSFSRNFRGHSGCGGGGGGSSFLRPGPVQRIAFIVSFSAPPPRRTVHGRPPRGRPERPWPDHTARSYRYSLISFRLAAGEGVPTSPCGRRSARDRTLLTQFLAVVIACAQASKAGITHRDSCVASRSSSGRSAAWPRKGVWLA